MSYYSKQSALDRLNNAGNNSADATCSLRIFLSFVEIYIPRERERVRYIVKGPVTIQCTRQTEWRTIMKITK